MKPLLTLLLFAASLPAQITWTKVWPPATGTGFNGSNGYEDILWDPFTAKVWIYSTNGSNSNNQIYSIRLHYFDPVAVSDTNVGDNGQTNTGPCLPSTSTWPATHHAVGQFYLDSIRHRLYTLEGVACTDRVLEEWYYPLTSPISGSTWTEVFPAGLATNHPGEIGAFFITSTNTLSAGIAAGDTSMSLGNPGQGVNQEFYQIDSEIVRITAGGNQGLIGSGTVGTGANPFTIARGQYGTTPASHATGATVSRLNGNFDNGKIVHDTIHDAFFFLGQRNGGVGGAFGEFFVKCDTSGTGVLTSAQTSVGCSRPDDWVDITTRSICADATACAAASGESPGRLPHGWYYPSMDFDPGTGKIVFFAGGNYNVQFQYSFLYDPTTFTWTRLNTTCSGAQCTGLLSVVVTAGGTGYTTAPVVSVNGCTGATATASVSGGAVGSVTITNLGTACSSPTVTFGGPGTGAAATATANGNQAPPVYSSNSENTRIAHALFQGKMYYHLSSGTSKYIGPVSDWVLDPIAQTWTEIQTGSGPNYSEAMTVDPASGTLYAWGNTPPAASATYGEIWQGTLSTGVAPTISTTSLSRGSQYNLYSVTLATTGNPAPTVSVTSGVLPTGMTVSTSGVLSGTPVQAGQFTFTVTATNGTNPDATQSLTLNIVATNGIGQSTYNCVDVDGDGYGVGPGCTGIDADDTDATVHSTADVLARYGNFATFWQQQFGWTPTKVLYVDGGTGSCTNVTTPFTYNAATACANINLALTKFGTATSGGQAIVMRGITENRTTAIFLHSTQTISPTCSQGYVYYISYPGEQPDFEWNGNAAGQTWDGSGYQNCAVIDGWKLHQACLLNGTCGGGSNGIANSGLLGNPIYGFVITHNDVGGFTDELHPQFNQIGTIIRHNYLHDSMAGGDEGHIIYLASDCPGPNYMGPGGLGVPGAQGSISCVAGLESSGTIIQGNVFLNGFSDCVHSNGPAVNVLIDSNWWQNCHKPIIIQNGLANSTITNNIMHTSGNQSFGWEDSPIAYASNTWDCGPMSGNLIANNTVFQDGQDYTLGIPGIPHIAGGNPLFPDVWVLEGNELSNGTCTQQFTTTASITAGSPTVIVPAGLTWNPIVGMIVLESWLPATATVTAVSGTRGSQLTVTLSQNANTTNASAAIAFSPDLGNNTYQNNLFVHNCSGCSNSKGAIFRYQSSTTNALATVYIQTDKYLNNIIKNFDVATQIVEPFGNGTYQNCAWFSNPANVPGASGNLCDTDPLLVAANAAWSTPATISNWNLRVQPTSPAIGFGLASNAPSLDLIGFPRSSITDGGYQNPAGCSISPSAVPQYTVNQTVTLQLTQAACTAGLQWSASGLPNGFTLNTVSGLISGTLSTAGTFSATISYDTASETIPMTVNLQPSITTTSPLPNATQGSVYSQILAAANGTGVSTFSITAGSLAGSGLSLNSSGVISGTGATPGPYSFTVTPRDANNVAGSPSAFNLTVLSNTPVGGFGASGKVVVNGKSVIH